jgi:hypothetical protein
MDSEKAIAKLQQCPPDADVATGEPEAEGRTEVMEIADKAPIVVVHSPLTHEKAAWGSPLAIGKFCGWG